MYLKFQPNSIRSKSAILYSGIMFLAVVFFELIMNLLSNSLLFLISYSITITSSSLLGYYFGKWYSYEAEKIALKFIFIPIFIFIVSPLIASIGPVTFVILFVDSPSSTTLPYEWFWSVYVQLVIFIFVSSPILVIGGAINTKVLYKQGRLKS